MSVNSEIFSQAGLYVGVASGVVFILSAILGYCFLRGSCCWSFNHFEDPSTTVGGISNPLGWSESSSLLADERMYVHDIETENPRNLQFVQKSSANSNSKNGEGGQLTENTALRMHQQYQYDSRNAADVQEMKPMQPPRDNNNNNNNNNSTANKKTGGYGAGE